MLHKSKIYNIIQNTLINKGIRNNWLSCIGKTLSFTQYVMQIVHILSIKLFVHIFSLSVARIIIYIVLLTDRAMVLSSQLVREVKANHKVIWVREAGLKIAKLVIDVSNRNLILIADNEIESFVVRKQQL